MPYDMIQCTRIHTHSDGYQERVHNWDVKVVGRVGDGVDGDSGMPFCFWTDCQRRGLKGDSEVDVVRWNPSIIRDTKDVFPFSISQLSSC